jgi:hypothetical protein
MQKVSQHVDAKVREVLDGAKVSLGGRRRSGRPQRRDEYFKEVEAAENLRRQLKEYLEEATKISWSSLRPSGRSSNYRTRSKRTSRRAGATVPAGRKNTPGGCT